MDITRKYDIIRIYINTYGGMIMIKDAMWIGAPRGIGGVCPEFFKSIRVHAGIKKATLCVTAIGVYEAAVNGRRVGDFVLAPGCTAFRERLQYQEYDVKKFFEKWLCDVRAEQFENGAVPDTVPNFWSLKGSSAAWGDVICVVPWQIYMTYGDKRVLEDNFDAMRKWVDFITADTKEEFLWTSSDEDKALWKKHYGDWLALDAPYGSYKGTTDDDFIASAFYAYSTSLVVKAGEVIGRDVAKYRYLYDNIVRKFKQRYSKPKTQTEHVLLLYFDLTDDKAGTAAALNRMIVENGNKLQTGFVGTPYLLHALSDNGYAQTAYSLLLQEEYPSWLYEVNHGATTIWEHWDGIRDDGTFWSSDMNSYNHYAYGSVIGWIYEKAAGIKPVEEAPGYERVIIEPVADERLGSLDVSYMTKHGTIRSSWRYENGRARYEISVPCRALVRVNGSEYDVEKGDHIF